MTFAEGVIQSFVLNTVSFYGGKKWNNNNNSVLAYLFLGADYMVT
jgi:hypothetical protein